MRRSLAILRRITLVAGGLLLGLGAGVLAPGMVLYPWSLLPRGWTRAVDPAWPLLAALVSLCGWAVWTRGRQDWAPETKAFFCGLVAAWLWFVWAELWILH